MIIAGYYVVFLAFMAYEMITAPLDPFDGPEYEVRNL
jgi:hypothetical protein